MGQASAHCVLAPSVSPAPAAPDAYSVGMVRTVCERAGSLDLIADLRAHARQSGLVKAVRTRDTAAVFDWFTACLAFQGISDTVAAGYMSQHGAPSYIAIARDLAAPSACGKLTSYWHFHDCGYRKAQNTCRAPAHLPTCPLPVHQFRNGRLNQTAYSLFLFIRDLAAGDLVGWLDAQLNDADDGSADRLARMRDAIIGPLKNVFGVSDKVLSMTLSDLLVGVGHVKPIWQEVGVTMIAVDTLVHNFLYRTGILARSGKPHPYGPGCYQAGGCHQVLTGIAERIDARTFNPGFPGYFPRFVQHAVWRYCAQNQLNVCNGNRIDDNAKCQNIYCALHGQCDTIVLNVPQYT